MASGQTERMAKAEPDKAEDLLSQYSAMDQKMIKDIMAQHPGLTAEKTIEMLKAAGGL